MWSWASTCWVAWAAAHLLGCACFNLRITPEGAWLNKDAESNLKVMCTADVPLSACQLSWWAEKESPGPVLDPAGRGPRTQLDGVLNYAFTGRGLEAGECGVTLRVIGKKVWTLGCRAVAVSGGSWRYAYTDLIAYSTTRLPGVVVEQSSVVVLPGKEAKVLCSAPEQLDVCYFSLPGRPGYIDFFQGLSSNDSAGRHIYRGAGPHSGECGLSWRDIGEQDNGPVRCYLWRKPRFAENKGINVIVARAPKTPKLHVSYDADVLRASCTVEGGRPVPDVQWLLGDDVIRNDGLDDATARPDDEWAWPWSARSITQNVTRRLVPTDYGKVLQCVTSHVALDEPIGARQKLSKSGDEDPSGSRPSTGPAHMKFRSLPCPSGSSLLESFCEARASVCPPPEDPELRAVRLAEAKAALRAAQLAEEAGRVVLEAAKASARAEDARARSEEARALEEEAWSKNAAEEIEYERERRSQGRKQLTKS